MSVAQPLPIGFPFFGNFRPWLCQDYLYECQGVQTYGEENPTTSHVIFAAGLLRV